MPDTCPQAHPVFRAAIDEVSGCTEPLLPQPLVQVLYPDEIDEPMYAEVIEQPRRSSTGVVSCLDSDVLSL